MRDVGFAPIWNSWMTGGPFVGQFAPNAIVTVDKDWRLNLQQRAGSYPKTPIRWFQRMDNSQVETPIPNVKNISWDRSLDTDAASLTLTIYNTQMFRNTMAGSASPRLGQPGFFTWRIGNSEAVARWGPPPGSEWAHVLTPDALLRTYQGYGGRGDDLNTCLANGNLAMTGAWLIDSVRVKTDGTIEIKARDMAKLLIEQHLYPPLIPAQGYPASLRYCRWIWTLDNVSKLVASRGPKRTAYQQVGASAASGSDLWSTGFDGRMAGHYPHEAFDGRGDTFWLSVGNDHSWEPFAVEWIEAACGDWIDTVSIQPWMGNYRCYISVFEAGHWVDGYCGGGLIPYSPLSVGRYTGANTANLPFVWQGGIPYETPVDIKLPRAFRADKIRITLTGLPDSHIGPFPFRGGIRNIQLSLGSDVTDTTQKWVQHDGNYKDYAEIIKDMALWSGFSAFEPSNPEGEAQVYGNIENTGIADTGSCIIEDQLVQKPVIDAMHLIRDIVGYWIWIDEEAGFHFESPNWWGSGNWRLNGDHSSFIPDIDEKVQMTEYQIEYTDKNLRSQIIVSSNEPTAGFSDTVTTYYTLPGGEADVLRGIVKPMMLINQNVVDVQTQRTMAMLIGIHIIAATYVGSLTMAANPCISLNDQVRIHEQISAETGIHYVRGITCMQDLDTGEFTMTLTTFRLGDDSGFQVTPAGVVPGATEHQTLVNRIKQLSNTWTIDNRPDIAKLWEAVK